jgi:septum formation protein
VAEPPVVLASGSPRRRELLERVGRSVEVVPADVDESHRPGEDAAAYVRRLARDKALAVAAVRPGRVVLGADTAVVVDGVPLGKPSEASDPAAATVAMLGSLSGRTHEVLTAVCVVGADGSVTELLERAAVTVAPLADDEVAAYVATGEPLDKAGGYALQGAGAALVTRVEGDPTTVIGLPLRPTLGLLAGAVPHPGPVGPQ